MGLRVSHPKVSALLKWSGGAKDDELENETYQI